MLQKLNEKLKLNDYNPDSPRYMEFATIIYDQIINEHFQEFKGELPATFSAFMEDIKGVFKELENIKLSGNMKLPPSIHNVSAVMESIDDIMALIQNNREHLPIFFKIFILQKLHVLTAISIQSNRVLYTSDEVFHFLKKKIQFSQAEIAKEWEVDNDTLSKWFAVQYGSNIYAKRKKINLSEYLNIFNDFFVLEEDQRTKESDKMMKIEKIDFYSSLALKGKTYTKKDIIEECFNPDENLSSRQYDEARNILISKFNFYEDLNKFPAAMAFKMIKVLRQYT